jgi:uncharacterized membrane protein
MRGAIARGEAQQQARTRAWSAGVLLGLGLGGFVDGIFLHQIAQWHNMGSAVVPPTTLEAMSRNMRWDGWFHVATLVLTLAGVVALWREGCTGTAPPSLRILAGQMLLGWGAFNLVEGIVDHHLLQLHHVRDMPVHVPAWDWLFLAVAGVLFILLGWLLARSPRRRGATVPGGRRLTGLGHWR